MPANNAQWAWFLFFSAGALGGIAYLFQLLMDLVTAVQLARARSRGD